MKTNAAGARFHHKNGHWLKQHEARVSSLSFRSTAGIDAEEKDAASLRPDQNGRSRDDLTVHLFLKAINE
jgi:hypothetical protein